jgi:hypothetical protein
MREWKDGCLNKGLNVLMVGWMLDGWMNGKVDGCMDGWMDGKIDGRMDV